jgi:hypothetical protein
MSSFYQQLTNGNGSRDVLADDFTVTSEVKKSIASCTIKSTYLFKGSSKVTKETRNLVERTSSLITLTKIEIIRYTNVKNVSINIRFLNDDNVLLFSETDSNLLVMSDHTLLNKLGIYIV